ncbi:MAG: lipoyl(octanoyl) transferase LipB [Chloroflexi bacterium]|nr:lipoyl(octanoyl) transferase LipB [Chloroflexota bacterium]
MVSERAILRTSWLGRVRYQPMYDLQRSLVERRQSGAIPDTLLLLEHEPVFTLGRRADKSHVLLDEFTIAARDAEVIETDRGGEATYHGPGQLVAYPIVSIRELKLGPVAYIRILEETTIQLLRDYGINGHRVVGKSGVWVDGEPGHKPPKGENPTGRKMAAIGVRVSRGIAMHGIALNVSTDLDYYAQIVPCGMPNLDVTSMERESDSSLDIERIAKKWAEIFADVLFFEVVWNNVAGTPEIQSKLEPVSV